MSTAQSPLATAEALASWFDSPLGRYMLEHERNYLDRVVADIFGYNALQFGLMYVAFDYLLPV